MYRAQKLPSGLLDLQRVDEAMINQMRFLSTVSYAAVIIVSLALSGCAGISGQTPYSKPNNGATQRELAVDNNEDAALLRYLKTAAEQGDVDAQFDLGVIYYDGRGVAQDYAEAARWYRLAAEQGDAEAQYVLGFMYRKGRGVAQDYSKSAYWYTLAAEQGIPIAQFTLGQMYRRGDGVPQDFSEAAMWYGRSASQGYDRAQYNLGIMYYMGSGVPRDLQLAYMWFNLAAAQGHNDARHNRKIVAELMTQQQITDAQKLARQCLARDYQNCD